MKKFNFDFDFYDEGLYCMEDIIHDISRYCGMNFYYLIDFFKNCPVILKDELESFLKKEGYLYQQKTIDVNYNFLNTKVEILKNKGLNYLLLMNYLKRLGKKDFQLDSKYEEILESCNLFHFRNVLMGSDIKSILIGFGNTFNQLIDNLKEIHSLDTYDFPKIDSFGLTYGRDRIYPGKEIVLKDKDLLDKTSIRPKKLKKVSSHC